MSRKEEKTLKNDEPNLEVLQQNPKEEIDSKAQMIAERLTEDTKKQLSSQPQESHKVLQPEINQSHRMHKKDSMQLGEKCRNGVLSPSSG